MLKENIPTKYPLLQPHRVFQQAPDAQINTLKLGNESLSHKVWALFKELLLYWPLGQMSLHTGPLRAIP